MPVLCVLAGAVLSLATIALDRYFDYRAIPTCPHRRPRLGLDHPDHGGCVDGQPDRPRADDHDGRRAAGDGAILAPDRAADPARQAEPVRNRAFRGDVRAFRPRGPRGDDQRRQHRPCAGDRGRDGVHARSRQHRRPRHVRASHRPGAARLGADRARGQGDALAPRPQVSGQGHSRRARTWRTVRRRSENIRRRHRHRRRPARRGGAARELPPRAVPGAGGVRPCRSAALPRRRRPGRAGRGQAAQGSDLPARADAGRGRRLRCPAPRRHRRAVAGRFALSGSDDRRAGDRPACTTSSGSWCDDRFPTVGIETRRAS